MFRKIAISFALTVSAIFVSAAVSTQPSLYEEVQARHEERLIIRNPTAAIPNHFWFDYRNDVGEAQKELASDLRRVSDTEDMRDAGDEYRHELSHNRQRYVREMAERGYR